MEPENDGRIAFLDCTVTRAGNCLQTSVYRKPANTSRLLDTTLVKRAHEICSPSEALEEELQQLHKAFTINKYPKQWRT